jgi:hypothetical protein
MILRNFSKDGTTISLVVNGKRIDGASLGKQCYEDYLYGSDNIMEKSFAAEEDKMSAFFGDLSPEQFASLKPDDVHRLRLFVAYQHARTRAAAEHYNKFTGALAKAALRGTLALNKDERFSANDVDGIEVDVTNAQNEPLWLASKTNPVLLDMDVKFITTDRFPGFVISDNPVVLYNQFAEHHPILKLYPTSTGFALKGLQLFMPLSPSMVLAVFDPSTYKYGGNGSVCRAGPADIAHLNRMQAVNALSCLYFHEDKIDDATLADLATARVNHPSIYKKHVATSPMITHEDGKVSQFVITYRTELRVGAKLSFVRTVDGHSYKDYVGPSVPVRSPELLQMAESFGQALEKAFEERKARHGEPSKAPG